MLYGPQACTKIQTKPENVAIMATFSGQGLMEMLTGLGFHVWMDTTGGYKAEKKGFKPISYKEYYDKADSIKAGGKPFKDIEAALAFAHIGYAE